VISLATPSNTTYQLGQTVDSSFTCTDGAGGPGLSWCADQGARGSGTTLDTSTPGSHTFTVTAASRDGLSSSVTVSYTVAAPPAIWLAFPADGSILTIAQTAASWFACADGSGGPGISSCVDQNGHEIGAAIDTSTLGSHTYTVTATSKDGLTTSRTVRYTVVPLPTVSNVRTHRHGQISLDVTTSAPGIIDVYETAAFKTVAVDADIVHPPLGSFVFARANLVVHHPATLHVKLPQTQAGRLVMSWHRRAAVRLWIVYLPSGGASQTIRLMALTVKR
jgi:hypothetical protein